MWNFFLLFFVFFGISSCSNAPEKNAAQEIVCQLSDYERGVLELFFRTLLTETSAGYTLFGKKPLSDEGVRQEKVLINLSDHRWAQLSSIWKLGFLVWEKTGFSKLQSNYEIHMSQVPSYEWLQIQLINVEAFTDVINENLSLFQYALGPHLSAKALLTQLRDPRENIDSIFRKDRVLHGIVLGYGAQNALLGSRSEYLQEHFMPSRPQQISSVAKISAIQKKDPSFGFSNLEQEHQYCINNQRITVSPEDPLPRLPWFACFNNPETTQLLKNYKNVQKQIEQILLSPQFLSHVLSQFFHQKISVLSSCSSFSCFLEKKLEQEENLSFLLGQAMWESLFLENDQKAPTPKELEAFIQGLLLKEKGYAFSEKANLMNEYSKWKNLLEDKKNGLINDCSLEEIESNLEISTERLLTQLGYKTWKRFKNLPSLISFEKTIEGLRQASLKFSADQQDSEIILQLELLSWLKNEE